MYLLSICDVPVCVCVCVCKVSALQKLSNKRARQESMAIYMEDLLALREMMLLLSPGLYGFAIQQTNKLRGRCWGKK